ncbi:MAG: hypothetical protein ACLRTQ_12520 [Candidatus Borkfalkia sp.]|jgi:hypothetical protein
MIGTEFVKMCREDIETHKDREVLAMLLQAVETLINENPGCEVDPNKTIDGLWKEMYEFAKQNTHSNIYMFDPENAKKFISEHLGMTERKFVNLEDFI